MFGAPLSVGIPARSLAVVRCGGTTAVADLVHAVVPGAISVGGFRRRGANSAGGLLPGHGMDGAVPAGLERMASAAEDEPRGCGGLSWPPRFPSSLVNAVLAVAIGCSVYALKFVYVHGHGRKAEGSDLQID